MEPTPAYEIDFAGIKSQAADLLNADTSNESVVPDAPVAAPVAEVPVADKAVPAVVKTPVVAELPTVDELDPETHGDRLVRVKVDGQYEVKALKEVAAGYSRTSHFTRQQQDLAVQRKDVEARTQQFQAAEAELKQVRNFLNDKNLIFQYLRQTSPELFATATAQPTDPNEVATVQQARELVKQQEASWQVKLQTLERDLTARQNQALQDLESRRETALYSESISGALKDIFEKNPILTKVRLGEDVIRHEVFKLQPKTIKDTIEAFHTVAKGMVEDLEEGFTAANKTKTIAAAKLATARIEPPGGSGPQLQPVTDFKRADGTLDWRKLREAAQRHEE